MLDVTGAADVPVRGAQFVVINHMDSMDDDAIAICQLWVDDVNPSHPTLLVLFFASSTDWVDFLQQLWIVELPPMQCCRDRVRAAVVWVFGRPIRRIDVVV